MKKVIVHENQKALLLKNGRFVKLLSAGKYHLFGDSQIELLPLDQALESEFCPLETLLADPDIAAQTVSVAVAEAPAHQEVITTYSPNCRAARDYVKVCESLYPEIAEHKKRR